MEIAEKLEAAGGKIDEENFQEAKLLLDEILKEKDQIKRDEDRRVLHVFLGITEKGLGNIPEAVNHLQESLNYPTHASEQIPMLLFIKNNS